MPAFVTIKTASLGDYKPIYWYGQPVYIAYPRLRSYLSIHLGEEYAFLFAQPRVIERSTPGGVSTVSWLTDAVSSAARPLHELDYETRVRIRELASNSISKLIGFAEHLKSSSDNEVIRWGELLEKACHVPDEMHIVSDGNKYVFAGWGFDLAGAAGAGVFSTDFDRRLEYKLRYESHSEGPITEEEDKSGNADSTLTQYEVSVPSDFGADVQPETGNFDTTYDTPASTSVYSHDTESNYVEPQTTTGGGGRQDDNKITPPWWKRWTFWLMLLLLLFLLIFLWEKCTSGDDGSSGLFPENPGLIVPIDTTTIISDPDSVRTIVSNRLNIAVASGNMVAFADALNEAYPDNNFKIIYYDTLTHRLQLEIPDSLRESLIDEIPQKIKNFELLVWHESLFDNKKTPGDPDLSAVEKNWFLKTIGASAAWDVTYGNPGIVVAIIDDGFDLSHPEFKGKVVKPWNVCERSADVMPYNQSDHGSHVAGTAVANRDNGTGICGIAPDCKLMPIKVSDRNGNISNTAVIDAVLYAIYQGANVVNLSLGMSFSSINRLPPGIQEDIIEHRFREEELFWDKIFKLADERNVTLVLAGGNDGVLIGIDPMQRNQLGIKVSAVDSDSKLANFSNHGTASTVSAPGTKIYSSIPGGRYRSMDGTSMAAPVVTGAVALIKSVNPDIKNRDLIELLKSTGIPVKSPGKKAGKLVQLDKALQKLMNPGNSDDSGGNCDEVNRKIDSLQREIDRLKKSCQISSEPVDTMKIPAGDDLRLCSGRWKSTTFIHNNDGEAVTLLFDINQDGSGKLTMLEPDNIKCVSELAVSLKSSTLSINQLDMARCIPPPGGYNAYEFTCKPDANGFASCTARNKLVRANKFQFRLIKIN
jgi:subtilisin family serine protease